MSKTAGLERLGGAAFGEIADFLIRTGALVFPFTVGATTYYAAVRTIDGHVIDFGTGPGAVINSALADCNTTGYGETTCMGATYPLEVSVTFPADELILSGLGRATFLDGDALATNEHAIIISGYTDCVVRDLAVQTEDGGGKTCHCVFIEDGADRFKIENLIIVNSDYDGIHIEGTNIVDSEILSGNILDVDHDCINATMDAGNTITWLTIFNVKLTNAGVAAAGALIYLQRANDSLIASNKMITTATTGDVIHALDNARLDIVDNKMNGTVGHAGLPTFMYLWRNTDFLISDNSMFTTMNNGIQILDCDQFTITDNRLRDIELYGISMILPGVNDQVHIEGNFMYNVGGLGGGGIYAEAATNLSIIANYMYGTLDILDINYGIYLDGISDALISDNYIISFDDDGIFLTGDSDDNNMDGNKITLCTGYGINISVATCNDNFVGRNYLLGNTAGCINDLGTDTRLPEITAYVTDPDGNVGRHPAIVLTDGVDVTVRFEIHIPSRFQEMVRARCVVVPAGNGNMRYGVEVEFGKICADERYDTHTGTVAPYENVVGMSLLECVGMTAALTGIGQGDDVGLEFTRYGAHANDTVDANCYLLKLNMQYV